MRLLAALLVLLALAAPARAQDPVVDYAPDDAGMEAAIADARETLDGFSPLAEVAFPVPPPDGRKRIGAEVSGRDGDAARGVLTNEPARIDARAGDSVSFDRARISDWMFVEDDLIHGAYTLRVMLPRLSPEGAADRREALAPLPG